MTLTQLEYLLAVHKTKNFSQAAELCAVTQPSLSAQIQKLEEELGVTLFDRARSPIQATEVGLQVIEQARLVQDGVQRLSDIAMSWKKEVKGILRLGVIPTVAPHLIPLFLNQFAQKYPTVQVILIEDSTHELVRAIEAGEVDMALLSTPEKAPLHLVDKPLFYEPFVIYANPSLPLLKKKDIRYNDLPLDDLLLLNDAHCLRDQVLQICHNKKMSKNGVRLEIKSGGLQTLIGLVKTSGGFTLLPYLATLDMTESQKQKQVRYFAKPVPVRKISLVFSEARLKRPLIDALHKEVMASLPEGVFTSLKAGLKTIDPGQQHFLI